MGQDERPFAMLLGLSLRDKPGIDMPNRVVEGYLQAQKTLYETPSDGLTAESPHTLSSPRNRQDAGPVPVAERRGFARTDG